MVSRRAMDDARQTAGPVANAGAHRSRGGPPSHCPAPVVLVSEGNGTLDGIRFLRYRIDRVMRMSSQRIGRIIGVVLITGGLLAGLVGCAQLQEALLGPGPKGPIVTLEAVPISVLAGEPVTFYVSARAREGRKIEFVVLSFGDGAEFKSERMAVLSIDRREIVHVYTLPDGVDGMTFEAQLLVYDDAGNGGHDLVRVTVGSGPP